MPVDKAVRAVVKEAAAKGVQVKVKQSIKAKPIAKGRAMIRAR